MPDTTIQPTAPAAPPPVITDVEGYHYAPLSGGRDLTFMRQLTGNYGFRFTAPGLHCIASFTAADIRAIRELCDGVLADPPMAPGAETRR